MYRDDYAAAQAKLDNVQRELEAAHSQGNQDKQQIALLTAQLNAARDALARLGAPMAAQHGYQFSPRSSAVLTLGILSLAVCSIMGPIAWSMGSEELRRIDAGLTAPYGRGTAQAGRICGIIGTSFLILGGVIVLIALLKVGSARHHHYY
jgi:hypothetical protein